MGYATILKRLKTDIERQRKNGYSDLNKPVVQLLGDNVWATGNASLVYVIPKEYYTLPYKWSNNKLVNVERVFKSVTSKVKDLVYEDTISTKYFKKLLKFSTEGGNSIYLNSKLVNKFGDFKKLKFKSKGYENSPVGVYRGNTLIGVISTVIYKED